jgi:hypothetical protein
MRIVERYDGSAVIDLTHDELRIIKNAINEICHGPDAIEEWEFQTRVGASLEEAQQLLFSMRELF